MNRRAAIVRAIAAIAVISAAGSAQAQQTQGPMTVERQRDGFAIAPDVEVSKVGSTTATMAGAYGGWVVDNTLLVGAGGYFQVNRSNGREMDYGGLVVEWMARTNHAVGFGARALVGGGAATFTDTVIVSVPVPVLRPDGRPDHFDVRNQSVPFYFHTDFFVTEPQADLLLNLNGLMRVRIGAGYRLIGGARGQEDQLRGATVSVALVIGGSSSVRITH